MAGKMQEGISVADLDADSLNESAENTQEDQIQDQIQNDQLEDAQLDDSLSPEHYDASDLRVLEGLEAVSYTHLMLPVFLAMPRHGSS